MDQTLDRNENQLANTPHLTTWRLIKAFWKSDQRKYAYLFLILAVTLTITLVAFDVAFNYWYNYFYNALQAYDKSATLRLLGVFCGLAAIYIIVAVYRYYLTQLLGLRWRKWVTHQLVNRWLAKRGYYYLENFDKSTDNPEQRIQEDVASLVSLSSDLTLGLIAAVTTFIAFIYILWQLSGVLDIPLGKYGTIHLPGYLVWVGLLYAFVGTFFTFKIGRPLVGLNFEQQRREATFRFAAMDLRSHSENVALYRGEDHEKGVLGKLFARVLDNYYLIILRQKLLLWFTAGYNQVSVLLPLAVALPNYFDKVFLLGGLIQSLQAFSKVQDSLSFIVNSYPQIATWQAVTQRLTTFVNHLEAAEEKAQAENQLQVKHHEADSIIAKQVNISTPQENLLLQNIDVTFEQGKHYVIKGQSGLGKSTFVRTLAGIWPFAAGEVSFPKQKKIMYLPQKSYMPIGTLKEAILFPDHLGSVKNISEVLRQCNLEHLIPRLEEVAPWSQQLSPGEQQRIAFARVLLQKPDWVFLDESTSMLDLANEKHLYELLLKHLPHCSLVSVGHRPSVDGFHDHVIDMTKYKSSQTNTM